jgi:hypothetical protein
LLAQLTTLNESRFGGPQWYESREQEAERVLAQELGRRGWTAEDLERLAKGNPAKLEIAKRLRSKTIMTWSWIAGIVLKREPPKRPRRAPRRRKY